MQREGWHGWDRVPAENSLLAAGKDLEATHAWLSLHEAPARAYEGRAQFCRGTESGRKATILAHQDAWWPIGCSWWDSTSAASWIGPH